MDYRALLIAPLAAMVLSVGATALKLPDGWQSLTHAATLDLQLALQGYEVGVDTTVAGSSPSLTVRSRAAQAEGVNNVGQAFQTVTGYAGQRVRFTGQLRAQATSGWAGLFLGLGDHDVLGPVVIGKAGVEKQLPMGAAVPAADGAWHEVSVVMDVPADAPFLGLGLALVGEGQVWARELRFDVVGPEVQPSSTPIGIDWAKPRRQREQARLQMAKTPPQPQLQNAALD